MPKSCSLNIGTFDNHAQLKLNLYRHLGIKRLLDGLESCSNVRDCIREFNIQYQYYQLVVT